jgi:putative transposase
LEAANVKRIQCDSIGWHVFNRGARRLDLFRDDQDYAAFMGMLRGALKASGAILWAVTLMSNHYHLVLYASSKQLTACMIRVNRLYARYHNRRYGLVGHAFDGPYKAYPQPSAMVLMRTIAYVFMNPVAAGITRRPEDYRWSCVRDYLDLPGSAFPMNPADVMAHVHPDPARAWAAFHRAMQKEASRPRRVSGDPLTRTQIHAQQFEWLLEHALEARETLAGMDPVRAALHWASQCGVTPRAMAVVLEGRSPAWIKQSIREIGEELQLNPDRARLLAHP